MLKRWRQFKQLGKQLGQQLSNKQLRKQLPPLHSVQASLESWYETPLGQHLLAEQMRVIDEELSCLFGYHLLQLSVNRHVQLYRNSRICHCINLAPALSEEALPEVDIYGDLQYLPLADESIDVTILHHVLEFSPNPHQLLREASRVTIPRGYIIIFGFNPHSLQGLIKPFARLLSSKPQWRYNTLSVSRVSDWLQFLDCNLVRQRSGFCNWPINNRRYLERTDAGVRLLSRWRVPFGNFYCLVARKDVAGLTPLKPKWPKESFMPLAKPGVAARSAARLSLIRNLSPSISKK